MIQANHQSNRVLFYSSQNIIWKFPLWRFSPKYVSSIIVYIPPLSSQSKLYLGLDAHKKHWDRLCWYLHPESNIRLSLFLLSWVSKDPPWNWNAFPHWTLSFPLNHAICSGNKIQVSKFKLTIRCRSKLFFFITSIELLKVKFQIVHKQIFMIVLPYKRRIIYRVTNKIIVRKV